MAKLSKEDKIKQEIRNEKIRETFKQMVKEDKHSLTVIYDKLGKMQKPKLKSRMICLIINGK